MPQKVKVAFLSASCLFTTFFHSIAWSQLPTDGRGPGATNKLSINTPGEAANANSGRGTISSNGRLVVYESDATNLIPTDTNGKKDIFLRNQKTGEIRRVSEGVGRMQSNGDSSEVSASPESPNGFIAFAYTSNASNLTFPKHSADTNGVADIFLHLPVLQSFNMRASLADNAVEANGASSSPSVTIIPAPDRVVIAYASDATNLASNDTNGQRDIFLTTLVRPGPKNFDPAKDLRTIRISISSDGGEANGPSDHPRISGDGRFVVFESLATNLIAGQTISGKQVYIHDIKLRTTTLISKAADGTPGNNDSSVPTINFTGNIIAYKTKATNIIGDGVAVNSDAPQFALFDTVKQTTVRVNVNQAGEASNGVDSDSFNVELSPSGRLVLFSDNGSNLVANDTNGKADIFSRDMGVSEIFRISNGIAQQNPDGDSLFPTFGQKGFNSSGGLVVFLSIATNLQPGDTQGFTDIFITDYQIPPRQLQAGSRLDVPPDVTVKKTTAKFQFEEFSGVEGSSKKVRYTVTIKKASGSSSKTISARASSDSVRKSTKKTSLSVKGLSSGTYTSSYKTSSSKTSTSALTGSSPSQRFTIE